MRYGRFFTFFVILLITLVISLWAINKYVPFQPSTEDAIRHVTQLEDDPLLENVRVTHVQSDIPQTILVVARHDLVYPDQTMACFHTKYITRHLLMRARAFKTTGWECKLPAENPQSRPIIFRGEYENGTYALAGRPVNEQIKFVQALWSDGLTETVSIIDDVFLFFRHTDANIEWVMGLDDQKNPLPDTKVVNEREIQLTLFDYDAYYQVNVQNGIVILGSFTSPPPESQSCLELTYLTLENAERYLKGQEALIGQRLCYLPDPSENISPSATTHIDGNKVAGGLVFDPQIKHVQIEWTDGLVQTVPVINGFYFVERPGISANIQSRTAISSPVP